MFGDYIYGTEILQLPIPENDFIVPPPNNFHHERGLTVQQVNASPIEFDPLSTYWFRWITGHQVMFIFWHLLTKELAYMEVEGLDGTRLDRCSRILHGGALIFEYTGSCSEAYYHQYVRPFMALVHKGFSGYWALDYARLPQLIRQITKADCPASLVDQQHALREAYLLHHNSHYNVAKKLVPEGASLLKNAKGEGIGLDEVQPHHYMMYDFFFMVYRSDVSSKQLEYSLRRRANALCQDLQSYPLPNLPYLKKNHLDVLQQSTEASIESLQSFSLNYA